MEERRYGGGNATVGRLCKGPTRSGGGRHTSSSIPSRLETTLVPRPQGGVEPRGFCSSSRRMTSVVVGAVLRWWFMLLLSSWSHVRGLGLGCCYDWYHSWHCSCCLTRCSLVPVAPVYLYPPFLLSCLDLSCLVWTCLVLSGLVLSCLVLSCLVLSCLNWSCLV